MSKSLAFTGHRPHAFQQPELEWVIAQLRQVIARDIQNGFTRFISGGALGVDQWAAREVLRQRSDGITLCLAIPFSDQAGRWNTESKKKYNRLLREADEVVTLADNPRNEQEARRLLLARNEWMVDNASVIVAVWNGSQQGGTAHCVRYARKVKKPILWIHPIERWERWTR